MELPSSDSYGDFVGGDFLARRIACLMRAGRSVSAVVLYLWSHLVGRFYGDGLLSLSSWEGKEGGRCCHVNTYAYAAAKLSELCFCIAGVPDYAVRDALYCCGVHDWVSLGLQVSSLPAPASTKTF
jgi:hypothetical protein